jgi:hypothetical protein
VPAAQLRTKRPRAAPLTSTLAVSPPMRNDWKIKEFVEPRSGKTHRIYWYRGKVCKRVVLDSPIALQMAGYVLIEKDLRSSGIWLDEIARIRGEDAALDTGVHRHSQDRTRYNLVKGLFVAALTFYGKSFAQCEGRRIKMERRQLSEEFYESHDAAISFRNNFAAHSGARLLERAEVALVLPPKSKKMLSPRLYREMTQPDYATEAPGEKTFAELIEHARSIALSKIAQLDSRILNQEVLPKGYAYWSAK